MKFSIFDPEKNLELYIAWASFRNVTPTCGRNKLQRNGACASKQSEERSQLDFLTGCDKNRTF